MRVCVECKEKAGSIDFYISKDGKFWGGGKKYCFDVRVVGDHWVIQNPGTGRSAVLCFPLLYHPPSSLPEFFLLLPFFLSTPFLPH